MSFQVGLINRGGLPGRMGSQPESEYPLGMCSSMAKQIALCPGAAPELASSLPYTFMEVFSGPNAPLTQAVRRALPGGRPKPMENEDGATWPLGSS